MFCEDREAVCGLLSSELAPDEEAASKRTHECGRLKPQYPAARASLALMALQARPDLRL
jgi:hypothetical protein